jgi:hypothetical protein
LSVFALARKDQRCQQLRAHPKHNTHPQKPVEINAARIQGAVEVIYCVLNRIVLGDEINKSVV